MRGGDSSFMLGSSVIYPRAGKGWGQLSMANAYFNTWFIWPPVVTQTMDISKDPSYSRTKDPDMAISSSLGLDVTMALGGHTDLQDWHEFTNNIVSGLQPDPRWQPRPWISAWPLMIIGATNINKDPGLGRTMGPDMVPGCSSGQDITMALGGSKATPICMTLEAAWP